MSIDVWCVYTMSCQYDIIGKDEILKPHIQAFRSKTVNDVR